MKINQNSTYIIAELGINHDGNLKKIIKLIKLAKKAGASAVKFQLFEPSTLANIKDKKKYKLFKRYKNETLFQMWERLTIKKKWLKKIEATCRFFKIDLGFFGSVSLGIVFVIISRSLRESPVVMELTMSFLFRFVFCFGLFFLVQINLNLP